PTRRIGCITTRLNASTNCLSTSSSPRHRHKGLGQRGLPRCVTPNGAKTYEGMKSIGDVRALVLIRFAPSHTTAGRSLVPAGCPSRGASGKRRASAIESECELVKVDLQVLVADAVVSPAQPGLEISKHAVDARQ